MKIDTDDYPFELFVFIGIIAILAVFTYGVYEGKRMLQSELVDEGKAEYYMDEHMEKAWRLK